MFLSLILCSFVSSVINKICVDAVNLCFISVLFIYCRVMVLDGGNVVEFDEPQKLLKDKNTEFYSMAKSAGLVS